MGIMKEQTEVKSISTYSFRLQKEKESEKEGIRKKEMSNLCKYFRK